MEFRVSQPPAELAPWVAAGVHVEFDTPGACLAPCHFPALVEGGLTLVLEGQFLVMHPSGALAALPAGFVGAARAVPLTLYRTPRLRTIGLRLQPAGVQALLQSSPAWLPHQIADAADVFGAAWRDLLEQCHAEPDPARGIALLFAFARSRLCSDRQLARTRRAAQLQQAALRLASPHEATGLGVRQFERVFHASFGLRPKLFQRVARVEGLLRDALTAARSDADIALRHGYYDQSHMARDLRALAGAPLRTLVQAVRQRDSAYWALAVGTSPGERRA